MVIANGADVVYTALFGRYEQLNEQPQSQLGTAHFVCYTDDPYLSSESWEIRLVEPVLPGDASRSSRFVKCLSFQEFGEASRSLYIDNSVILTANPTDLLDVWLANTNIAMVPHSSRSTVSDEFDICVRHGLDSRARLREQRRYYSREFPTVLDSRPFWGGMIARRDEPDVRELMMAWYFQILRFSRRDQLSLPAASLLTGVNISPVNSEMTASTWHEWPRVSNRKHSARQVTPLGKARRLVGSMARSVGMRALK